MSNLGRRYGVQVHDERDLPKPGGSVIRRGRGAPPDVEPRVEGKPKKGKGGRPRLEVRDRTIEATKPWLQCNPPMSRASWYRREAERRKSEKRDEC